VGSHPTDRALAERAARAEVTGQISRSSESEVRQVMQMTRINDQVDNRQTATFELNETIAKFDEAHLIRTIDTWEPRKKGEIQVFACLVRGEVAQEIRTELDPKIQALQTAYSLANKALEANDIASFTNQYRVATGLASDLYRNFAILRAIDMRTAQELDSALDQLRELRTHAARIRESVRISVTASGGDRSQLSLAEGEFRKAIESLGLQASDAAMGCRGDTVTHAVQVEARPVCKTPYFGFSCTLEFAVVVEACESDNRVNGLIQSDTFKGTDNQHNEAKATGKAWAKLTAPALVPGLHDILDSLLPVD
jgi:hypothetical protein